MKNNIFWLLILLVSCATFNQSDKDLVKQDSTEQDQIGDYEFTRSKLTKSSLKNFEPVAIEKFYELFEQMKIATHPEYDDSFKQEAVKALLSTLVSKTSPNLERMITDRNLWTYLNEYAENSLHEEDLNRVYFSEPFQLTREDVYEGIIAFELSENKGIKTINTYLIKVIKTFGTDQEEVWEVRFDLFRY